jgi:hypothetical protein
MPSGYSIPKHSVGVAVKKVVTPTVSPTVVESSAISVDVRLLILLCVVFLILLIFVKKRSEPPL